LKPVKESIASKGEFYMENYKEFKKVVNGFVFESNGEEYRISQGTTEIYLSSGDLILLFDFLRDVFEGDE